MTKVETLSTAPPGWPAGRYRLLTSTARRPGRFIATARMDFTDWRGEAKTLTRTYWLRVVPAGAAREMDEIPLETTIGVGDQVVIPSQPEKEGVRVRSFHWEPLEVLDDAPDAPKIFGPCQWDAAAELGPFARLAPRMIGPVLACDVIPLALPGARYTLRVRLTAGASGRVPGHPYRVLGPGEPLVIMVGRWHDTLSYAGGSTSSSEHVDGIEEPLRPGDRVWFSGTSRVVHRH